MTRIVAIDTSTWWGGVALVESARDAAEVRVAAEVGLTVPDSHTIHLLELVETLMGRAGWSRASVDAYAASRGPGSFTGIRVGLGTVRGLGLAAGRPSLGVTSLAAMAEAFGPAEVDRLPLIDAGRSEVYGARYDAACSPPGEVRRPWLAKPGRLLESGAAPAVLFGSGADRHGADLVAGGLVGRIGRAPRTVAAGIGRLAAAALAAGAVDGEGLSPLYLRPSDAELNASAG